MYVVYSFVVENFVSVFVLMFALILSLLITPVQARVSFLAGLVRPK